MKQFYLLTTTSDSEEKMSHLLRHSNAVSVSKHILKPCAFAAFEEHMERVSVLDLLNNSRILLSRE